MNLSDKPDGYFFYPSVDGILITKIPLSQNKFAIIDIHNADKLTKYQWQYDNGYASRKISPNKHINMHQEIMGKKEGLVIDHINWEKHDNREINLRHVTYRENSQNHKSKNYSSRYPGVCYVKNRDKWQASIRIGKKFKTIGRYDSEKIAYKHYLKELDKIN